MRATWSRFVVDTLVYLALGGVLVQAWKGERTLYRVPGLASLILILVFMLLQIVPLPMAWIAMISPAAADLYRETVVITGGLDKATLSITPDRTLLELFRFAAVVAVYVLSIQLLSNRQLLKKTVNIAVVFGAVVALFGIVQHFTSGGKLYWFRELAGGHFGPFVYRNHFAGFMVLLFPLSFALFHLNKPQVRYGSFRESLVDMLSGREVNLRVLYGLSALVVATSVFVSLSRGGVTALCFSAFFLSLLLLIQKGGSKKGLAVALFFFLVVLSVSWFGWEALIERFANTVNEEGELWDGRFTYWADTKRIASDFRWVGSGFGSFVAVFPSYQSLFIGDRTVSHAHGDYYELLATGGVVGFLLFAWFASELVLRTIGVYRKRRERYSRYLYLALGAGLLGFMAQALAEFNFYSGAGTLWFYFVAALWVSVSHTRLRGGQETFLTPVAHGKAVALGVGALVGVVFIASVHHNLSRLGAEYAFSQVLGAVVERGGDDEESRKVFDAARKAVARNPLNPRYHLAMASLFHLQGEREASSRHFARAAALNPASADLFHRFARFGGNLDRNTISYCLEQARDRDVMNPERSKYLAASLFDEGDSFGAMAELKRAMTLSPTKKNIGDCLRLMIYHGALFDEITELIPPLASACLVAADFFEAWNREDLSEEMIGQAHAIALSREKQEIGVYSRLCDRFLAQNEMGQALSVLQQAAKHHPDNVSIFIRCGDIYSKMGIGYRARDEYRKALAIRPNDRRLLAKMKKARGTL